MEQFSNNLSNRYTDSPLVPHKNNQINCDFYYLLRAIDTLFLSSETLDNIEARKQVMCGFVGMWKNN